MRVDRPSSPSTAQPKRLSTVRRRGCPPRTALPNRTYRAPKVPKALRARVVAAVADVEHQRLRRPQPPGEHSLPEGRVPPGGKGAVDPAPRDHPHLVVRVVEQVLQLGERQRPPPWPAHGLAASRRAASPALRPSKIRPMPVARVYDSCPSASEEAPRRKGRRFSVCYSGLRTGWAENPAERSGETAPGSPGSRVKGGISRGTLRIPR